MGQRLVVEVKGFGETICTVYYHWDAYTMSTLYDAKKYIALGLQDCKTREEVILKVIRFCESEGGGVCYTSMDEVKKMFSNEEFREDVDRNYGLVDISEKGIDQSLGWAEGNLTLDLVNETAYTDVYSTYASETEYREEYGLEDEPEFDIPELDADPQEFPFDDVDAMIELIDNCGSMFWYNGIVFVKIE